jgi:hypothetical protein
MLPSFIPNARPRPPACRKRSPNKITKTAKVEGFGPPLRSAATQQSPWDQPEPSRWKLAGYWLVPRGKVQRRYLFNPSDVP